MRQGDEQACVQRVLKGDLSAFSDLVFRYQDQVFGLALSIMKNAEDAEEVSQDAFLKAYGALSKFRGESSFSTWLYKIVYNTALSRLRKKKLDTVSLDVVLHDLPSLHGQQAFTVFAALVEKDREKFLREALAMLSEEEALLVDLYYHHQKDMHEIALILGMTHVNVRVKLSRVRKKLHLYLCGSLKKEIKDIL